MLLDQLPDDLLLITFASLSPEDLEAVKGTSRRYRDLINANPFLWKDKLELHFPEHLALIDEKTVTNWYEEFVKAYTEAYADLHPDAKKLRSLINENNVAELHQYVEHINSKTRTGETPAFLAVKRSQIDALKKLQELGADLDTPCQDGMTLAYYAAYMGLIEVLMWLNELCIDIHKPINNGCTLAHAAAQGGHINVLIWLSQSNINIHIPIGNGMTLAYLAAFEGQIDVLMWLLQSGINIHTPTNNGQTLAHAAAQGGKVNVLIWLLQSGINIHTPTNNGKTLAHFAALGGMINVLIWLQQSGIDINIPANDGMTLIHAAANSGRVNVITWQHQLSVNIHLPMRDGITPIFIAAATGQVEALAKLIELGADPHAPTHGGLTPADIAVEHSRVNVLTALHQYGLDLNRLVYSAAGLGRNESLKKLHELGADLNTTARGGLTLACFAAGFNQDGILKTLHELGIDLNAPSKDGSTPLSTALLRNHVKVLITLHQLGIDMRKKIPAFILAQMDHSDEQTVTHLLSNNRGSLVQLIPPLIFYHDDFFQGTLNSVECHLMSLNEQQLWEFMSLYKNDILRPDCAWLALYFKQPSLSHETLIQVAHKLGLTDSSLLEIAVATGQLTLVDYLIHRHHDYPLQKAAELGYLDIFNRLIDIHRPSKEKNMMMKQCLITAGCEGHLNIVNRLIDLLPKEDLFDALNLEESKVFRRALLSENYEMAHRLLEVAPDRGLSMVRAGDYDAFNKAVLYGHIKSLNWLLDTFPDEQDQMILNAFDSFIDGMKLGNCREPKEVIRILFSCPGLFAQIEERIRTETEYRYYLDEQMSLFTRDLFEKLKANKIESEMNNPSILFDIHDERQIMLCFYSLRYQICKQPNADLAQYMNFFLQIPAVNHFIQLEERASELLTTAMNAANQTAIECLLTDPVIRCMAEQKTSFESLFQHETPKRKYGFFSNTPSDNEMDDDVNRFDDSNPNPSKQRKLS